MPHSQPSIGRSPVGFGSDRMLRSLRFSRRAVLVLLRLDPLIPVPWYLLLRSLRFSRRAVLVLLRLDPLIPVPWYLLLRSLRFSRRAVLVVLRLDPLIPVPRYSLFRSLRFSRRAVLVVLRLDPLIPVPRYLLFRSLRFSGRVRLGAPLRPPHFRAAVLACGGERRTHQCSRARPLRKRAARRGHAGAIAPATADSRYPHSHDIGPQRRLCRHPRQEWSRSSPFDNVKRNMKHATKKRRR